MVLRAVYWNARKCNLAYEVQKYGAENYHENVKGFFWVVLLFMLRRGGDTLQTTERANMFPFKSCFEVRDSWLALYCNAYMGHNTREAHLFSWICTDLEGTTGSQTLQDKATAVVPVATGRVKTAVLWGDWLQCEWMRVVFGELMGLMDWDNAWVHKRSHWTQWPFLFRFSLGFCILGNVIIVAMMIIKLFNRYATMVTRIMISQKFFRKFWECPAQDLQKMLPAYDSCPGVCHNQGAQG